MAKKARKNSLTVDFDGFNELIKKLDAIGGGATERAVEQALKESRDLATADLKAAFQKHDTRRKNGDYNDTISHIADNEPVEWNGGFAKIAVGFDLSGGDLSSGGFPGQFIMYGTTVLGQPHIKPEKWGNDLYNALYGAAAKKKRQALQEKVILDAIAKEWNR